MTTIDKVKASKAKCKRHRDNWKSRALAYEDIIRRAKDAIPGCKQEILNEANKLKGGK
jgi:hypothetical protein